LARDEDQGRKKREMNAKISLLVLFGGRSGEYDVSLMSARSVLSVLDPQKYDVFQVGISREGKWLSAPDAISSFEGNNLTGLDRVTLRPEPGESILYKVTLTGLEPLTKIDVVFPVLHGTYGEDGTLQGLLEMADLAYVGAGVLGSAVGMDKALFKDVMRTHGIPVVDSVITSRSRLTADMDRVIEEIERMSPYPVFVKPANLGSSVGVSKCRNRSDLVEGLMEAAEFDRRILIEKGINAREIEVSVLGNDDPKASVAGEILPSREFYDYNAKYIDNASGLVIPAPLELSLMERIRKYALDAYKAADISGMARVDFLLEKDTNQVFLNELNTIPGFTRISMYPKLWEASGLPYPSLVDRLIELALERKADRDHTQRTYRRDDESL
jgi:D-alanine-D-alanine ligase